MEATLNGKCDRIHSEDLKAQYEQAKKAEDLSSYEVEFMRLLDRLVAECDRRIQSSSRRLSENQAKVADQRSVEIVRLSSQRLNIH